MTQSTKDQITSWFTLVSVICEIKCGVILYKFFCWDQQKYFKLTKSKKMHPKFLFFFDKYFHVQGL